jgi:hypothetical protein
LKLHLENHKKGTAKIHMPGSVHHMKEFGSMLPASAPQPSRRGWKSDVDSRGMHVCAYALDGGGVCPFATARYATLQSR